MALVLHLAWISMTVLRFAGIIIVFAGVALFGVFFIGANARATDSRIPASSWNSAGSKRGIRIIALGAIMLLCAFIISLFMPNGL
jgi:formate hydrogenlyase subunit 4